jgi:hypothetical protein
MIIENAQWSKGPPPQDDVIVGFLATINGEKVVVPKSVGNIHYDEAMRQVAAGELTIADAD